ncbi:hypothetical protein ANCCEY_10895 [Ancylostoma ceylanicum]|uniref:FHOD1 N-terminal GTPase-binding domain-containing protein n=2 Tax=Ancylostoma ceylanicum TaxID=53326 RepID=A0A0D6LQU1_9BILA|nr:hypothetical protein ANCCEY_10895 [Ancylostoma ceylanicum]
MAEDTYTCRVQYVDDSDPFASTSNAFLEPMRPVTFAFRIHVTIADQLPEVIRTLRAPHKPGDSALQLYKSLEKGGGEFLSYLDSDLTLVDQNDEFEEMKSDRRQVEIWILLNSIREGGEDRAALLPQLRSPEWSFPDNNESDGRIPRLDSRVPPVDRPYPFAFVWDSKSPYAMTAVLCQFSRDSDASMSCAEPAYSTRYPRLDKAVYSAAPVKASLARTVPSYDELYSSAPPVTQKPILKAYDIDLSIRIDASSSSMHRTSIGRVTCTFDEIDAYKPRSSTAKLDLPLIVKPLRQFDSRDSTLDRRSRSSEARDQPLAELRPQRSEAAPGICRRRTMGGADDMKPKWYSSSVDGAPESSTLPKNFLRKPTVLHTAAPVQVEAIPYIDDDVPTAPPPPKPARSFTQLNGFVREALESPAPQKTASDLFTCIAKPVQFVDPVSAAPRKEPPSKPFELSKSSFAATKQPFTRSSFAQSQSGVETHPEKDTTPRRYPWQVSNFGEPPAETKKAYEQDETPREVVHCREDSGYRSDRKPSLDYSKAMPSFSKPPSEPSEPASLDESFSETEPESDDEDDDDEDFQRRWEEDHHTNSKKYSLVLRTQVALRVKTIIDKLLSNTGRDQRRALFSLKKIFQDDRDLVPEFVQNGGLDCMVRLGRLADQNHQNYILRGAFALPFGGGARRRR